MTQPMTPEREAKLRKEIKIVLSGEPSPCPFSIGLNVNTAVELLAALDRVRGELAALRKARESPIPKGFNDPSDGWV